MPAGGNAAEWLTRKKRIDTKLNSFNPHWQIVAWHGELYTSRFAQNQFEERKLQEADRVASHKALADVISIVKPAATAQAPVLNAEERVNRAMDALATRHKFTTEQLQWLSLVREQLIKNLTIDEEDFDNTPLLQGRGGVARAKQVFGELGLLVAQLNEAMVT